MHYPVQLDSFRQGSTLMNLATEQQKIAAGFCSHGPAPFRKSETGPLAGMSMGVKDLFAIAGYKNSAGNPDWYASHEPASKTASAVGKLMQAGVEFRGFTLTDELAYSLEGNNHHYGKSANPKLPGHACGGSSMGSAAATAGAWVDIGLGTDTGGSVRVPASYCGLFGIRPSHGMVAAEGLIGLAPRFDTVGWLTRTVETVQTVGDCLLPAAPESSAQTLCVDEQLLDLVEPALRPALNAAMQQLSVHFARVSTVDLQLASRFSALAELFRVLQGRAIANYHRHWLITTQPTLSAPVQSRMAMALAISDAEVAEAEAEAEAFCQHLRQHLPNDGTLLLPTTPTTAPKLGADTSDLRPRLMQLTAIAGLTGAVQIHLPLLPQPDANDGQQRPYGFSLLRHRGHDRGLLKQCVELVNHW